MARTQANTDLAFERIKRVYINQFMRTDPQPQEISERLYLGSVGAAYNEKTLRSLKITHILTVCDCLPPKFPEVLFRQEFEYKVVDIADDPRSKLSNHFKDCTDFIKNSLDAGGTVLVHCFAGVSRSATIVIAYLMKYSQKSFNEALSHARKCRPWINPNYGFMGQLRRYNAFLQKKRSPN